MTAGKESLFTYLRFAAKFWAAVLAVIGVPFGSIALTIWILGDPWDLLVAAFWIAIALPYLYSTGHTR